MLFASDVTSVMMSSIAFTCRMTLLQRRRRKFAGRTSGLSNEHHFQGYATQMGLQCDDPCFHISLKGASDSLLLYPELLHEYGDSLLYFCVVDLGRSSVLRLLMRGRKTRK